MWHWAVEQKRTYGLTQDVFMVCDALKRMWREKHPQIVQLWQDLEDAFKLALTADKPSNVGQHLRVEKRGSWLVVVGPAGDVLCYPGAKINAKNEIVYLGQNQYTRQWGYISTYGGKIAENITQWLCRDLLAAGLVGVEKTAMETVLHVHDEIVAEFADNRYLDDEEPAQVITRRMTEIPWAPGLPLAVAAHVTDRYHKE